MGEGERELWARTAAEGWREDTEFADVLLDIMRISAEREDALLLLAELVGRPVAAGALAIHEGVAIICAEPGSASQRNAERQGLRIAYTRIKWGLVVRGTGGG